MIRSRRNKLNTRAGSPRNARAEQEKNFQAQAASLGQAVAGKLLRQRQLEVRRTRSLILKVGLLLLAFVSALLITRRCCPKVGPPKVLPLRALEGGPFLSTG